MSNLDFEYTDKPSLTAQITQFGLKMFGAKEETEIMMDRGYGTTEPAEIPSSLKDKNSVSEEIVYGSKVWNIIPKSNVHDTVIYYIHGGSYINNINKFHWDLLEEITDQTGSTVIVPDYPLAPAYTYKDAYRHVEAVYDTITTHHNGKQIVIMGDSAGGGLSLAFSQKLREEKKALPDQLILLSPWLDVTMTNPQIHAVEDKDPMLSVKGLIRAGRAYAGDLDVHNYMISPIYGELSNLPPVSIFTGTYDILNPDARKLRDLMKERNLPLSFFEYEEMFHVWVAATFLKESKMAVKQISELINRIRI